MSTGRLIKFWNSTTELPGLVALSLQKGIKAHPKPGWVRGGSISNPELLVQLNEMRRKNEQLQEHLDAAIAKQPKRAELKLAPANSRFTLKGTYQRHNDSYHIRQEWTASPSWNEIIALLGPHLFQPLAESGANTQLAESICKNQGKENVYAERVDGEIFSTVKIQLLALGYIELKSLATKNNGMVLFWSITPLGKEALLQMRTIKAP